MKNKGFSKVSKSDKKLFGPRAILGYGFSTKAQTDIIQLFTRLSLPLHPLIFVHDESLPEEIISLLQPGEKHPQQTNSRGSLRQTMLLSGLTEQEVHMILNSWHKAGFPAPLWAVLTPTSQHWSLRALILALEREAQELKKQQKS